MLPSTVFIAFRFFLESKRSMLLSAVGVVFGVAFFITGQAQTEGFQKYFIETILGSKGAIIIRDRFQDSFTTLMNQNGNAMVAVSNQERRKFYPGIDDAYRVMKVVEAFPNVAASAPVVQGDSFLRSGFRSEAARIYGIDLNLQLRATDFAAQIVKGSVADFRDNPDSIGVGALMALDMGLALGDNVYLKGYDGSTRRFKITAIYETGVNVIDEKRVYVHRRVAQTLLGKPYYTSHIVVKLKNPERAPQDAQAMEALLSHRSRPWQEREKGNMQIFQTLRISAALGISCIILLAGFGIFNVLTMSVLEKVKEISILRSMGYTKGDISSIFLIQGFFVAILGTVMGWVLGAGMTYGVTLIPVKIRGILKADHFIVSWSWHHYLMAALLGFISVLIASYVPARRAAQMKPVNVLRGTSQ